MKSPQSLIFVLSMVSLISTKMVNAQPVVPTKSILQVANEKALKDLSATTAQFKIEVSKAEGYDPCKVNLLRATKKYDQWFVDHFSQIESLSTSIDSLIETANQKIDSLSSQTVSVNPLQGQTSQEVSISLAKMIDYFNLYNARLKTCSKDAQSELAKQMEDPENNTLGVAHSQVLAAMDLMTKNLNASLKSQNASFLISFTGASCGYSLDLKVNIKLDNLAQNYSFPLLATGSKSASSKIQLGDAERWAAFSKSNSKIAEVPIDAVRRFQKFLNEEAGTCSYPQFASYQKALIPYMTSLEISDYIAKAGPGISDIAAILPDAKNFLMTQLFLNDDGLIFALDKPSSIGDTGLIRVWDPVSKAWKVDVNSGQIQEFAFSPVEKMFVSIGMNNAIFKALRGGSWAYTFDPGLVFVAISDTNTVFGIGTDHKSIFNRPGSSWVNTQINNAQAELTSLVVMNNDAVFAVNKDRQLLSSTKGSQLSPLQFKADYITRSSNSNSFYVLESNRVSRFDVASGTMSNVGDFEPNVKIVKISVNAKEGVCGLTDKGAIYCAQ